MAGGRSGAGSQTAVAERARILRVKSTGESRGGSTPIALPPRKMVERGDPLTQWEERTEHGRRSTKTQCTVRSTA